MIYNTKITDNILRITLEGDLIELQEVQRLMIEVNEIIQQGVLLCIADISLIRYMNSTGINILTTLLAKFRIQGGEMVLTRPSEQVKKLLIITKLTAIFTIVEDHAEALIKLKNE